MARNTTRQGANFELKVMHDLEEHGYTCLRSSGSRGAVDVWAVPPLRTCSCGCGEISTGGASILAVQCKITNPVISPAERLAVQDLALRARALPIVAHWAKDPKTKLKRIYYRQLTGPGPDEWAHWAPGEDD